DRAPRRPRRHRAGHPARTGREQRLGGACRCLRLGSGPPVRRHPRRRRGGFDPGALHRLAAPRRPHVHRAWQGAGDGGRAAARRRQRPAHRIVVRDRSRLLGGRGAGSGVRALTTPLKGSPMTRRPLALALLLALLPAAASAEDLLQTYDLARNNDTQLAISEANRDISHEGRVQARAALLPQLSGRASLNRSYVETDGAWRSAGRSRSVGVDLVHAVFDLGAIANLRAQQDLDVAAGLDLEAANHELITRTSAAYFNVLVAIETLAAAEAAEAALQKQFDFADKRLEVG